MAEFWDLLKGYKTPTIGLKLSDYAQVAANLKVEVAALKAVVKVETNGNPWHKVTHKGLTYTLPKILFEAHKFAAYTNGIYNASHPDLSSRKWNKELYVGGAGEYFRLAEAFQLSPNAALQSASIGMGQIMGGHWKFLGFASPQAMWLNAFASEANQLNQMALFISKNGLTPALRAKDWNAFAYRYNGSGYKRNKYDTKLAFAYTSFRA